MPTKDIKPKDGGKLITAGSDHSVGLTNFIEKVNLRRSLDVEEAIPGYSSYPGVSSPDGVTQFADLLRPNGEHAVIACTPTTIYRWNDATQIWDAIGTGYDPAADKWEVKTVNGYAVFNNGSDLPFTYRVEDIAVVPMHQLREVGVTRASCMEVYQGFLCFGDVTELTNDAIDAFMNNPIGQSHDNTRYGRVIDASIETRTPFRIIWSDVLEPRRWKLALTGTLFAGSNQIALATPTSAFTIGDVINIGTLTGVTVMAVLSGGLVLGIDTVAAVNYFSQAVTLQDYASVLSGYDDIQQDGSHVLRILSLKGRLVVYRNTGMSLGVTTGDSTNPIIFEPAYIGANTLAYKWALVSVQDDYHVFHGRSQDGKPRIYSYDLINRSPRVMSNLELVRDKLMDISDEQDYFFIDNALTKEVWICLPEGRGETMVFDYETATVYMIDKALSACAEIIDPSFNDPIGASPKWFVMADYADNVLVNEIDAATGETTYTRLGAEYTWKAKSGLEGAGVGMGDNVWNHFMLIMASSSDDLPVTVELFKAENPGGATSIGSRVLTTPKVRNFFKLHAKTPYFQYKVSGNGGKILIAGIKIKYRDLKNEPISSGIGGY